MELAPWGSDRLRELARRRSPNTCDAGFGAVVEAISPATPLAGLLALQEFVVSPDADALVASLQREQDLVGELPERLRGLYQALSALGPVSASDPELLRAVGVSRSRITHGLKELEEHGLVEPRREGKKVLYSATLNAARDTAGRPVTAGR